MFTGIIEGLGTIVAVRSARQGRRLAVKADFDLDQTKIGDSIAVSGACLTVVRLDGRRFEVDVSPETLQKTTLGAATVGERVNLERALRLSDRLDGHLVSGHIDGMGVIRQKDTMGGAILVTVEVPRPLARYMIVKGSVAVDGISLTVNTCDADSFSVSIIPHTAGVTTMGFKRRGERVNIETDMIGKYVERFAARWPAGAEDQARGGPVVDKEFLIKSGFLK